MAFTSDGSERRWVRQAVMGVLRWRDLQGSRVSINGGNNNNNNNNNITSNGNLNNNLTGSHHINSINNNNRNEVSLVDCLWTENEKNFLFRIDEMQCSIFLIDLKGYAKSLNWFSSESEQKQKTF